MTINDEVEIVPFTWGKGTIRKLRELEGLVLERGMYRFRPFMLAALAREHGLKMNSQRAANVVRKHWEDWIKVTVHLGTMYVHVSKYLGSYEAEIAKAKEIGLFEPPNHKNGFKG